MTRSASSSLSQFICAGLISLFTTLLTLSCDLFPSDSSTNSKFPIIPDADDSSFSDSLRSVYREDAARLALTNLSKIDVSLLNEVEIPHDMQQSLYNVLILVHTTRSLPARDSVIDLFKIHTFPYPETRSLIVSGDSSTSWMQAWRRGDQLTGNQIIDNLIRTYDLRLKRYYAWPMSHAVVLDAGRPLNIVALAKRFVGIQGLGYAEPNGVAGDGNRIEAAPNLDHWQLDYSFGFWDCPAGCIGRHYWTFNVFTDRRVEYVGSRGTPLPIR